jgi:hypothetical protein
LIATAASVVGGVKGTVVTHEFISLRVRPEPR